MDTPPATFGSQGASAPSNHSNAPTNTEDSSMPATTGSQGTSASPSYAQASTETPIKALPRVYVSTDKPGWPKDIQVRVYQALSLRFGKHSLQQVSWDDHIATFIVRSTLQKIEEQLQPAIEVGHGRSPLILATNKADFTRPPRPQRPKGTRIQLANLPIGYTKEDINNALSGHATVYHVAPDMFTLPDGTKTGMWLTTAAVYVNIEAPFLPTAIKMGDNIISVYDKRDPEQLKEHEKAAAARKKAWEARVAKRKLSEPTSTAQHSTSTNNTTSTNNADVQPPTKKLATSSNNGLGQQPTAQPSAATPSATPQPPAEDDNMEVGGSWTATNSKRKVLSPLLPPTLPPVLAMPMNPFEVDNNALAQATGMDVSNDNNEDEDAMMSGEETPTTSSSPLTL